MKSNVSKAGKALALKRWPDRYAILNELRAHVSQQLLQEMISKKWPTTHLAELLGDYRRKKLHV